MTSLPPSDLPPEHAALFAEAKPGIERLVARMTGPTEQVVFVVAEADSPLGATIVSLGVPRGPQRKSVVMPLTRADAIRAAGPLMSPTLTEKLERHAGPSVLIMASGSARLVSLG
jgi:hypothetical protein